MAPPKKKARTPKAASLASSASDVAFRDHLRDWVNIVWQGRHGYPDKRKWPLEDGGSFLNVVQRVWNDQAALIENSVRLLKTLGVIGVDMTNDEFMDRFVEMKDRSLRI